MEGKYRFRRRQRLVKRADYKTVFANNSNAIGKYWLVLATKSGCKRARLGLVISKKILTKAADRNLYKRIAREVFRLNQHSLAVMDFVVMARENYRNEGTKKILHQELLTLLQSYDKSN